MGVRGEGGRKGYGDMEMGDRPSKTSGLGVISGIHDGLALQKKNKIGGEDPNERPKGSRDKL